MSQILICEKCGAVTNKTFDTEKFCPICHGKLIGIDLDEISAAEKYKEAMSGSPMPIVVRNECIRKDYYYGKIEKKDASVAITQQEYEQFYGVTIRCPQCNSDELWSLVGEGKHICSKCKHVWR